MQGNFVNSITEISKLFKKYNMKYEISKLFNLNYYLYKKYNMKYEYIILCTNLYLIHF